MATMAGRMPFRVKANKIPRMRVSMIISSIEVMILSINQNNSEGL